MVKIAEETEGGRDLPLDEKLTKDQGRELGANQFCPPIPSVHASHLYQLIPVLHHTCQINQGTSSLTGARQKLRDWERPWESGLDCHWVSLSLTDGENDNKSADELNTPR